MLPNIGLGELTIIVLVALLVFGPKRLPEMMRSAGRALGRFQREAQGAMQELRDATNVVGDLGAAPDLGAFDMPDPAPMVPPSPAPADAVPAVAAGAVRPRRKTQRKTVQPRTVRRNTAKPGPGSRPAANARSRAQAKPREGKAKRVPAAPAPAPAVTEPFEDT